VLAWLALTGVWAALAFLLFSHPDRPPARAATRAVEVPRSVAAGVPSPGRPPSGEPASAPPEIAAALPEARRVAAAFAMAYATWRYDEPTESMTARLAPLATAALRSRMATPASGATAARDALRDVGQFATASVEAVQTQHLAASGIGLLVLVRQEVHSAAGVEVRRPSYAVRLTPEAGAWLVADFTP
jgi:hypothetical protein